MLFTDNWYMNPRSCLLSLSLSLSLSFSLSIFGLLIIISSKNAIAQPLGSSCFNSVMDKAYGAKVNSVLSSLSTYSSASAFHNSTAGVGSSGGNDVVYGLYLCRGDVNKADCQTCVQTASKEILQVCPNDKTAIVWYDNCFLRYSNQTDFPDSRLLMWNTQNSTDPQRFNQFVGNMLNTLATQTTSFGVSGKKFAVEEGNFTAFDVVFSLAQCIPIISSTDCDVCLRAAIREIPEFCDGCLGARVLSPICNIRFESYRFYNVVTPGAPHVDNLPKRPPSGPIKKKVMLPPHPLPTLHT